MKMRKLLAILMALALVMSFSVGALAAPIGTAGEITVKNVVDRTELDVYQILTYTYDSTTETYNTVSFNTGYQAIFLKAINSYSSGGYALTGTQTAQEILLHITNTSGLQTSAFAKHLGDALQNYIDKDTSFTGDAYDKKTAADPAESDNSYTFSPVASGYYLIIDRTAYADEEGAVIGVMLQPMSPGVVVTLKSDTYPPVVKVADDTSYFIGDEVNYTITLPVPQFQTVDGTITAYAVTDTLGSALDRPVNEAASFTITMAGTTLVYDADYVVTYGDPENTIIFTLSGLTVADYVAAMGKNIVITYAATINHTAPVEDGIVNSVEENGYFGDSRYDGEEVFTHGFKFNKVDENRTFLPGMTFKLYAAASDGSSGYLDDRTDYENETPLTFTWDDATKGYRYDVTTSGEEEIVTLKGYATTVVYGLKEGTYILIEETAAGYTELDPQVITLPTGTSMVYQIMNISGITIPGTGGIGTTLFTIFGGVIILGAFTLLIANRKRIFGK